MSVTSDAPVLLVTGASRGIGQGIAHYFLEHGYIVCGCSRSEGTIDRARYHHDRVDVSDEKAVSLWVSSVSRRFRRIDVAVCSAGLVKSALLMAVTPTAILDEFLATNVRGTFNVCREVSKVMVRRRSGRIITLSSLAVPLHLKGAAGYAASKSAVEEMTRVLARELAPAGVTCNIVSPALVMTDAALAMGPEWKDWLVNQQTIQRTVTVEEVCNVIAFLASPASAAVTGQTINMCHVG